MNNAIDNGFWVDGFEIAIKNGELDYHETNELLGVISNNFPETKISPATFLPILNDALPQGVFAPITWLIADDMTIIASDSLRVARLTSSSCIWSTPRLSYDGIELISIDGNRVNGLAWLLKTNNEMDSFTLSFFDGSILDGTVVN